MHAGVQRIQSPLDRYLVVMKEMETVRQRGRGKKKVEETDKGGKREQEM